MLPNKEPKPYSGIRSTIADIVIEQAESGNGAAMEVIQAAYIRKRKAQSHNTLYYELEENEKADCIKYFSEYLQWETRRHFTVNSLFMYIAWKKRMYPHRYSNGETVYFYWPDWDRGPDAWHEGDITWKVNIYGKAYRDEKERGAAVFIESLIGPPVSKRRWNTRKVRQVWNSLNSVHSPHFGTSENFTF